MTINADIFEANLKARYERAATVFRGAGRSFLRQAAGTMATSSSLAIDYIEQAPFCVVLIATSFQSNPSSGVVRKKAQPLMAESFARRVACAPKLRAFLADIWENPGPCRPFGAGPAPVGLYQLRALRGSCLRNNSLMGLLALARINPSTLAQIIPKSSRRQVAWLSAMTAWTEQICRRERIAWTYPLPDTEFLSPELTTTAACVLSEKSREWPPSISDGQHIADFMVARVGDFGHWSVAKFRNAMAEWELTLPTLDEAGATTLVADYSPLPNETTAVDGFEFVPLRTHGDLIEESQAMRHCVYSYWSAVQVGASRIFSIRIQPFGRVATLELERSGAKWRLRQIKGYANAKSQPGPTSAAHAFVDFQNFKGTGFDVDPEVAA